MDSVWDFFNKALFLTLVLSSWVKIEKLTLDVFDSFSDILVPFFSTCDTFFIVFVASFKVFDAIF